jgi:Ca2+-binding RTX toxin-like protein
LHGGLGKDKLTGGGGADAFVFDTTLGKNNVDTITDFATKKDKIVLDNSIFTALSETGLTKSELLVSKTATKAKTADQHLIYNTNKGELYYDADGKGGESAIKIAIIGTTEHPTTLSVDHFSVIGG